MNRETEIKLLVDGPIAMDTIARAATNLDMRLGDREHVRQTDTYLDDSAMRLARAGIGLRVRSTSDGDILCWKSEGTRKRALFSRREIEVPWDSGLPERSRDLPRTLRDRTEPLIYDGRLRPVVRLTTERHRTLAESRNGSVAEICVDHVEVFRGDGQTAGGSFDEIEIEIRSGAPEPWLALAQAISTIASVRDSRRNKLHRALAMIGTVAPEKPKTRLVAGLDPAEAAFRTLRRHFARLQQEEIRVRTTDTEEPVHKLRVACRRMRAAMQTFRDHLPDAEIAGFERLLRDSGREFSRIRDLDVLLPELEDGLEDLPAHLRADAELTIETLWAQRRKRHEKARRRFPRKKRLRQFRVLQRYLETGPTTTGSGAIDIIAPGLLRDAAESVFRQGRRISAQSTPETFHELRKRMKRLRYTAEFFGELYGRDLERFIDRTRHMQDVLGAYNDACVAQRLIERFTQREDNYIDLPYRAKLALGAWTMLQQLRAQTLREKSLPLWNEFDSDDLRTYLEACLLRTRPAAR